MYILELKILFFNIKKNQKNQYFVYDVNFKLTNNFNFFPKR